MHPDGQSSSLPLEITVAAAKALIDTLRVSLIDVREREEYVVARIPGAELIPMGTVPQQFQHIEQLSDENALIVFCHHGVRSLHVVEWLRQHGVENAQSMQGGIDAWSRLIDAAVPRY